MLCLFIVSKRNVSVFDEIRLEKRKNWKNFAYLPAEDQENDGHGQLDQHQDEQQDKKLQLIWNISNVFTTCNLTCYLYTEPNPYTDEHASILSQATQKSKVTHACGNGTGHHKSVGRVDGPEWGADGSELGVDHLKFPKCHHKCTTQLQHTQKKH